MSMTPPDMVREAKQEWLCGSQKAAHDLVEEASRFLSPCRIYQLLGQEVTQSMFGVVIDIRHGKSVTVLSYSR